MANVYSSNMIVWNLTDGTYVIMETLPPAPPTSQNPYPVSGNSTTGHSENLHTILGGAYDSWYNPRLARWDNGALTLLAPANVGDTGTAASPYQCSADGSIIVGWPPNQYGFVRWTGTGSMTVTDLPPGPNGGIAGQSYESGHRNISSDGRVIMGSSVFTAPTVWIDGVPHTLTSNYFDGGQGYGCSADGSTILFSTSGNAVKNLQASSYARVSDLMIRPINASNYIRTLNSNGTVIWSDYLDAGGYTDNLDVADSNGNYGTYHAVPAIGSNQYSNYYAEDTFSPNPVSAGGVGGSGSGSGVIRVTGTTAVILDASPYTRAIASGISGNGQIISGFVDSGDARGWLPLYWDAAGVMHMLPMPDGWNYLNQTVAVSRDGTKILGTISTFTTVPDPPPIDLALRLVDLPPQNLPANFYQIVSDEGSDFPETFGQYSISVWCCEGVTLQWPTTDPKFGILTMTPAQLYAEFHDPSGTLLFTGTFHNPNPSPPDLYHISFAIDTEAQVVTCWGNNTKWVSTDAAFFTPGVIGNPS